MNITKPRSPLLHRLFLTYIRKAKHRGKDHLVKWVAKRLVRKPLLATTSFRAYMLLDPLDYVQYEILRNGVYEGQTINLLRRLLKAGHRFLDIGGNVGLHTLAAAQIVGSSGGVTVFEPNPKVFQLLLRNVKLNEFENVEAILTAVSNRTGLIKLAEVSDHSLGTSMEILTTDKNGYLTGAFELGPLLRSLGIPSVDVMKVDVEGQEMKVLEGLFRSNEYLPSHIILEFFPSQAKCGSQSGDLLSLLARKGYEVLNVLGKPYNFRDPLPEYNLWARRTALT